MQCEIDLKIISENKTPLNDFKILAQAVRGVIVEVISRKKSSQTINLITPGDSETLKASDFKTELLTSFLINSTNVFRQDLSAKATLLRSHRKNSVVFLVQSFRDFEEHLKLISTDFFKLNGSYIIVLLSGRISAIKKIFRLSWQMQIYNIIVMYEEYKEVFVESFMPFNSNTCDDITPIRMNIFTKGKFLHGSQNIFVNKMNNFHQCPIRVSIANASEPFVGAHVSKNGSVELYGPEVDLLRTLAESLNFRVNFTFIGKEGYVDENGTSDGALKALIENDADISLANWWLKPSRLKFFDTTIAYASEQIVFHVPPADKFTALEKLFYPFTIGAWFLVVLSFCFGAAVIFVVKFCPKYLQLLILGSHPQHPVFNMVVGFIGQTYKTLPKGNLSRFLLAMFLMYCIVVRSFYQGSFVRLLQSNKRHKEIQTIDEIMQGDYTFYVFKGSADILQGTLDPSKRCVLQIKIQRSMFFSSRIVALTLSEIPAVNKKIQTDKSFKGVYFRSFNRILYEFKVDTNPEKRFSVCKEPLLTMSSVILTRKDFYLIDALNWKLHSLKQSGLIDYWRSQTSDMNLLKIKETPLPKAYNLKHMQGSIQILIIGYILSIVAFVFELICSSLFQSMA